VNHGCGWIIEAVVVRWVSGRGNRYGKVEAMKKFSIRALMVSILMFVVVSIPMGVYALVMIVGGRGSEQAPSWVNITLFGFTSLVMASAILWAISFRREIWEALRYMWGVGNL